MMLPPHPPLLFANGNRAANIARLRKLLSIPPVVEEAEEEASCDDQRQLPCPCPRCGGRMIIAVADVTLTTNGKIVTARAGRVRCALAASRRRPARGSHSR